MIARSIRLSMSLRSFPVRDVALLAVGFAILAGLNYLRLGSQREAVESIDSFSSYDAAQGGYRAWYEMLQREDVAVTRFEQRPSFLNGNLATLVWAEPLRYDPRQTANTKADVHALEDWVKAGGRLLYLGYDDVAAKAGILKLPVTQVVRKKTPRSPRIDRTLRTAGVERVAFESPMRWKIAKKQRARTTVLVGDAFGPLAVEYPYGRGRVVAALDESAFANRGIVRADNARLAYALSVPQKSGGSVAFDEAAHGYLVPDHWWAIVPRPFLVALALATAALLVAFSGAAIRLGPPIVPPRRTDASSAEFVDSLAALFERGRAARKALGEIVDATTRVVATALGFPHDAPAAVVETRIESPALREDFRKLIAASKAARVDEGLLLSAVVSAQHLQKEYVTNARRRH